jgi:transglutaminase-like putative cysteine protease
MAAVRRAKRGEKFVTLLLMFILLTAAAAGVTAVLTGPDWTSLWESLLIGLLVGWVLAILRLSAWRSALLVAGLGLLFCLLFAGGLNGKVLAVFEELFRLAGNLPIWQKSGEISLSPLGSAGQQMVSATSVVLSRVFVWVSDLIAGQAVFDPVAAGIVWSLVVWLVAAWAGWSVEAGYSALIAVLPALGVNLATLSYGRSNSVTIYLLLGLTLVLIAMVQYTHQQQGWEQTRVAYPQHKGRQIGYASLLIAVGLVILSVILSSISLKRIAQLAARPGASGGSGLAKSLGIQAPPPTPSSFSNVASPGLPRELLIGSGPELSYEQVMSVNVTNLTSLVQTGQLPPLYWRSFTYDIYTGHGWSTSPTTQTQYPPGQPIQPSQLPYHQLIQEEISPVPGQEGTIYAAGEPISVDIATTAAWRSTNDLFGLQTSGSSYTVNSLIPLASEDTLRAAGQDYPAWVKQRYLALPAEVTSRVKGLAIQLTAAEPTPYDRARAIEQYLRSTFPYTTDVPYPPANQDLVDYFLFDLRKGYCDYYASAMVVLARAAGLPARLATGYANGTYNLNSKRFIVTQADAHSWVEVYFPGTGWVLFEPTAGSPELKRSAQPPQPPTPSVTPVKAPPSPGSALPIGAIGAYIAVGLLALGGFLWAIYDEIFLGQLQPRPAAAEIFRRIWRYGRFFKAVYQNGQTPYEYLAVFTASLETVAPGRPAAVRRITTQVETITQRIVRLSYRPTEAGEAAKAEIVSQWKPLRWQLRLMWVFMFLDLISDILQPKIRQDADKMHTTV